MCAFVQTYLSSIHCDPVLGRQPQAKHPQSPCFQGSVCLSLSHVLLFATPWTVACQAPLSTGFSRQKCWST